MRKVNHMNNRCTFLESRQGEKLKLYSCPSLYILVEHPQYSTHARVTVV